MASLGDSENIVGEEAGKSWQHSIDQPPSNQDRCEYQKIADKLPIAHLRALGHGSLRTAGLASKWFHLKSPGSRRRYLAAEAAFPRHDRSQPSSRPVQSYLGCTGAYFQNRCDLFGRKTFHIGQNEHRLAFQRQGFDKRMDAIVHLFLGNLLLSRRFQASHL